MLKMAHTNTTGNKLHCSLERLEIDPAFTTCCCFSASEHLHLPNEASESVENDVVYTTALQMQDIDLTPCGSKTFAFNFYPTTTSVGCQAAAT
jgi:hypothetical protein